MSLLNGHAERAAKALDYYLSLESPQMRSRVYRASRKAPSLHRAGM
ncbi:MAG: hypothetical protein QNJ72_30715 [Pleurocapsa sp. MO_226.B13]|nr:hypothetical protein [Pleurocapsa sp. MO_226.B13]